MNLVSGLGNQTILLTKVGVKTLQGKICELYFRYREEKSKAKERPLVAEGGKEVVMGQSMIPKQRRNIRPSALRAFQLRRRRAGTDKVKGARTQVKGGPASHQWRLVVQVLGTSSVLTWRHAAYLLARMKLLFNFSFAPAAKA